MFIFLRYAVVYKEMILVLYDTSDTYDVETAQHTYLTPALYDTIMAVFNISPMNI